MNRKFLRRSQCDVGFGLAEKTKVGRTECHTLGTWLLKLGLPLFTCPGNRAMAELNRAPAGNTRTTKERDLP